MSLLETMRDDIGTLKEHSTELNSIKTDLLTLKDTMTNPSTSFSSTISMIQNNFTTDIEAFRSEVSDRFTTISLTFDSSFVTARTE